MPRSQIRSITKKDFYSLFAFFNNVSRERFGWGARNAEPLLPLPSREQAATQAKLKGEFAAAEKGI